MGRTCWITLLSLIVVACGSTCQHEQGREDAGTAATAEVSAKVELEGVDTSKLTPREHAAWSGYVSELLSPCPEVAVSIAQCVREKRDCALCVPAAKFLLRQVQAGHPKEVVVDLFGARFDKKRVKTIALGDSPAKGADNPAVTLVEFADFECGGCGDAFPFLEELYKKHGKKMKFVFKHYPLEAHHPNAELAAQASYAAQQQDQFWKMHRTLFENQERLTEPDLIEYAKQLGLDVDRFKRDMHSDAAKEAVEKDKKQGQTLGVEGTPTLFINGRECDLQKLGSIEELEHWLALDIELADKTEAR